MWKKVILILNFALITMTLYSQQDSLESKIFNNDSIKWDISTVSPSEATLHKDGVIRRYIYMRLTKKERNYLLTKDSAFWFNHLNSEQCDWATNLVLYYIFRKDATEFHIYNSREKWLKVKKDELEYWRKTLPANLENQRNY